MHMPSQIKTFRKEKGQELTVINMTSDELLQRKVEVTPR